jgi:mono/diheme cytochrome c family protein
MPNMLVNATGLALALALSLSAPGRNAAAQDRLERGEYLATIMDCGGCHTPGALRGQPDHTRALSGSDVGFEIPGVGIFYPPNLTPDRETGLGKWSETEIIVAVRNGARPDGRALVPVMPFHAYARLTDSDADALVGYLKSLQPLRNPAPAIVRPGQKATAPYLKLEIPQ